MEVGWKYWPGRVYQKPLLIFTLHLMQFVCAVENMCLFSPMLMFIIKLYQFFYFIEHIINNYCKK
jgi:hypothetical protein